MAKTPKLFKSKLGGYDKAQVDEYIENLKKENEEEIFKLKKEKYEEILKLSSENAEMKAKLEELQEVYDKMYKKQGELLAERNLVTKTLVDAEKRADQIVAEAISEGEEEKSALSEESDKIKKKISEHGETMKKLDEDSKAMLIELIDKVRTTADVFESKLMATIHENDEETDKIIKEANEKIGKTEEEIPNLASDIALEKDDEEEDADDDSESGDGSESEAFEDLTFASGEEASEYFNTESA